MILENIERVRLHFTFGAHHEPKVLTQTTLSLNDGLWTSLSVLTRSPEMWGALRNRSKAFSGMPCSISQATSAWVWIGSHVEGSIGEMALKDTSYLMCSLGMIIRLCLVSILFWFQYMYVHEIPKFKTFCRRIGMSKSECHPPKKNIVRCTVELPPILLSRKSSQGLGCLMIMAMYGVRIYAYACKYLIHLYRMKSTYTQGHV